MSIKNLKMRQNCFKKENYYFYLLIGLIITSGLMLGIKTFQVVLISPEKINLYKNHDLIKNLPSNDLEEQYFKIKRINNPISPIYNRFSIEEFHSYNESSPIIIDGNSDFINQAILYNWTGDGGYSTPYNITNLNITANNINVNLIDIRNTNLFFEISNCLLQSGRYGVYLNNASHGSVVNTLVRGNTRNGIDVNFGNTNTFSKLLLFDNAWSGINIGSSNNTNLIDINCTNNGYGIGIYSSRNNSLSNIYTCSNLGTGISISDSENSDFSAIISRNNQGQGLSLQNSNYSSFLGITCFNNSGTGIRISESLNSDITQSSFSNNTGHGFELDYSNKTSIRFCNFSNNTYNGIDLEYFHHFVLINLSLLYNGYDGLKANTASNGSLVNITCSYNNVKGFEGENIKNSVVSKCIIVNNSDSGISFTLCQNISLLSNIIAGNFFAPYSWYGGFYIGDSNNITISHNFIFRNKGEGLRLSNTNETVIAFNAIYKQDYNGISIESISSRNLVSNNIVYNNAYSGFRGDTYSEVFTEVDKNVIVENDFIANEGDFSQVSLYGKNFIFHHNYWDDLQPLDENEDGIVDIPYLLRWNYEENEGIYDTYPLVEPTNTPTIHYLTSPFLLYPRNGFPYEFSNQDFNPESQEISYNGTVRILWVDPIDSENHQVAISIFYSRNYGENWTEIVSGIDISYYDWDTTTVLDGNIMLRVEAICTHGESTMDTDQEMIRIDNRPPVLTDLRASPFSHIVYIVFGLMIVPISRRIKRNNRID